MLTISRPIFLCCTCSRHLWVLKCGFAQWLKWDELITLLLFHLGCEPLSRQGRRRPCLSYLTLFYSALLCVSRQCQCDERNGPQKCWIIIALVTMCQILLCQHLKVSYRNTAPNFLHLRSPRRLVYIESQFYTLTAEDLLCLSILNSKDRRSDICKL